MKPNVAVVLTSIFALSASAGIMGADWPSFRGPTHDGISDEAIAWPSGGPRQVWKINVGIGHSAVSVVGNRAYTMGNSNDTDTVFSIDVGTGKIVWTIRTRAARKSASRTTTGRLRRRRSPTASCTR